MTDECFAALHPVFKPVVETLKAQVPAQAADLLRRKGIYALSEGGIYLYVGISGNLRSRWQMHRSGDTSAASFAVKLAREKTGRRRTYTAAEGLNALSKNPEFREAFQQARATIRRMDVRFLVWDRDDDDLAVLEMYAARALDTKYNEFKTH